MPPSPTDSIPPLIPKVMKYAGKAHVRVYRMTGGRVGGKWRIGAGWKKPVQTLLLDHVGRKSGRNFTTPLLYLRDGPDVVIVACRAACRRTRSGTPTRWRRRTHRSRSSESER